MIIVLEGPDGTGKTTLARELEAQGFEYVHNGVPPPNTTSEGWFNLYTSEILGAAATGKKDTKVVFDRLHIGEIIYGPVMRGQSLLTLEQIHLLNRILVANGGVIIHCTTDFSTIKKNWEGRKGKEYVDENSKLERIKQAYDEFFKTVPCYVYNYETDNYIHVLNLANMTEDFAPEGVNGEPNAEFLVVGEKAGGPLDIAFYSWERSSHFLYEALHEAGYRECDLAFTNALHMNGDTRDLRKIREEMMFSKVIALGNIAQNICLNQGIPYLPAPHPQYVKRFESNQRHKYVNLLRQFRTGGHVSGE